MISFIIPAHNEAQLLDRTLDAVYAVAGALGTPFEVIVVDDASTDDTGRIARERGARVVPVAVRQIAAARNAGAAEAHGDMLIFVDADTVLNESVVRAAVDTLSKGAVGGGCAFTFDGKLPLYGRILSAVALPLYRAAGLASGCFVFCTRDAFRAVGGFDEKLFAGEEAALSLALRRQGRFIILRETVLTSGRKFRAHSAREILGMMARLALAGPKSLRHRKGLDVWYGERRADPTAPGQDVLSDLSKKDASDGKTKE